MTFVFKNKMRRHNIVFGIFLILSIIAFALATPVLVQEKHNVHIPKDKITVLGKRGGKEEDLQELVDRVMIDSKFSSGMSDANDALMMR